MKRTTKKLSGVGLELFLRRFYAGYPALDDAAVRQLAKDSARAFASVRIRRIAWQDWRRGAQGATLVLRHSPQPSSVDGKPGTDDSLVEPAVKIAATPTPSPQPTAPLPVPDDTPFDPYVIGLIPTFQREGPDGLLLKLETISSPENLRKMARSQQVSLPADLRKADAAIDDIRAAIVAAVGKRIADRRAAAG